MTLELIDDDWYLANRVPSFPHAVRRSRQGWRAALKQLTDRRLASVPAWDVYEDETHAVGFGDEGAESSPFSDLSGELSAAVTELARTYADVLFGTEKSPKLSPLVGFGVGLAEKTEGEIGSDPAEFSEEMAFEAAPALLVYANEPWTADDARRELLSRKKLAILNSRAVEVRVISGSHPVAAFQARRVPSCGGCSVSHLHEPPDCGTFGSLAVGRTGRRRRRLLVLTSAHVVAPAMLGKRGDPVLHPGRKDDGQHPDDEIALVERVVRPVVGRANLVDAATARANPKRVSRGVLIGSEDRSSIERLPGRAVRARLGMTVRKSGRSTFTTEGFVRAASIRVNIRYPDGNFGFADQIDIADRPGQPRPLALVGDSGSIIWGFRYGRAIGPLGMLTAVRQDHRTGRQTAIANRMRHVLRALDIVLYP